MIDLKGYNDIREKDRKERERLTYITLGFIVAMYVGLGVFLISKL